MKIDFVKENRIEDLGIRVRAIIGVPEEILTDDIISSPTFLIKAEKFINNKIADFENIELDMNLINISYLYYVCYLLCSGMYARLPKQMENLSTKTILPTINWDELALDMLNKANETIDEALEEFIEDDGTLGNTFAVLSAESEYPNTTI